VDITHNINFDYYTVYSYATRDVKLNATLLFTKMSGSKIPNNTQVQIDGGGTGIVKSSRNENDGTIYDVEIEGTGLCFPFSQHRLEIIRTVGM
jgi:hypothetical protein